MQFRFTAYFTRLPFRVTRTVSSSLLVSLLVCGSQLPQNAVAGTLYKWVDDQGNLHYSDQVPPEQAKQGREVLNQSGRTVEKVERSKTAEELAEEKHQAEIAEVKHKQEEQQKAEDRMLLLTFQSVSHIETSRDNKIQTIENSIQIARSRMDAHEEKLENMRSSAADFERAGKPVPASLVQNMGSVQKQIDDIKKYIEAKKDEQAQIRVQFAKHIRRYKELTGASETR